MTRHGNKSQISATINPKILNRFDQEYNGDRSQFIEQAMRNWLDMNSIDDKQLINRKEELEEKLDDLEDEEKEIDQRKSNIKGELTQIEAQIQRQKKEQEKIEEAIPPLVDEYQKKRRKLGSKENALQSLSTTKRFHSWLESLEDYDSEQLKQEISQRVEN